MEFPVSIRQQCVKGLFIALEMHIKISYIFLWMIEVNYKDNMKGMCNIVIMTHFIAI